MISGVLGIKTPFFARLSSGSKIFFPIRHGPYMRLWPRMIPATTMSRRGNQLVGEGKGGSSISLFTPRFRFERTLFEPMNRQEEITTEPSQGSHLPAESERLLIY